MEKIVERLKDAKVGDLVYCIPYQNRLVDKPQIYIITGETKISWLAKKIDLADWAASKFNKEDGRERKRDFADKICGRLDHEDDQWVNRHSYRIGSYVQGLRSVETLKQIAAIIGYDQGKV